jgi:hypothetical protein
MKIIDIEIHINRLSEGEKKELIEALGVATRLLPIPYTQTTGLGVCEIIAKNSLKA